MLCAITDTLSRKRKDTKLRCLCADGYPQDRRPITPPPCVRLVVKDEATGKEVDIK